jgi:hypothetical protein
MAKKIPEATYVTRIGTCSLIDDVDGRIKPANREIQVEANRAKYLDGLGMTYIPGEDAPDVEPPQPKPKGRRSGLKQIETDPEAE